MFQLNKVKKARKRLEALTSLLFKAFQINLRYKENRKDYGLEIFEYFYLPWRTDLEFTKAYEAVSEHTLNPKSRLYTIYDLSKKYLLEDTSFVEVGCWKGGVTGLVSVLNKKNNIDYYACDTFSGVANSSINDTFFKDNEYGDASIQDVINLQNITLQNFQIVEGIFPESMKNINLTKKISFAHIDVDTYISAKESFDFIMQNAVKGAVVVLDDYGGWFTDGVTKFGNELKLQKDYFAVPNHLGQMIIFKVE